MPQLIRIDNRTFQVDDAHAPAIQGTIDQLTADHAKRLDALTAESAKAAKASADLAAKLDGLKARVGKFAKSLRARIDAMKARMMGCDECAGSGKVMDAGGIEQKCDYCGGDGMVRMHDEIKAMEGVAEEVHPEEDIAAIEDELSREPAAEEALEQAANPEHNDAAKANAKRRADARLAARSKRRDSLTRISDRRAASRASLLMVAQRHLGTEAKLDGKSDADVRKEVLAKLAPHVKLDGLDARAIDLLYGAEIARADAAAKDGAFSAADQLRAGVITPPVNAGRQDNAAQLARRRDEAMANAWQNPGAQPTITPAAK